MSGKLRIALDGNAEMPMPALTAKRHRYVLMQPWDLERKGAIKAARSGTICICHKNLGGALDVPPTKGVYSSGLSYSAAKQWALGPTMYGYAALHAMDVGDVGYQEAWAEAVCSELQRDGWDGALLDNSDIVPAFDASVTKYADRARWLYAMESCIALVGAKMKQAGLLAIPNIGAWGGNPTIGRSWLAHVDGGMHEQFLKWGSAGSGYADPARALSDINTLLYADSIGKFVLCVTHSSAEDNKAALYGYCGSRLANRAFYCFAPDYAHEVWIPAFDIQLGKPMEKAGTLNGIVSRQFKNDLVTVNTITHTGTIEQH